MITPDQMYNPDLAPSIGGRRVRRSMFQGYRTPEAEEILERDRGRRAHGVSWGRAYTEEQVREAYDLAHNSDLSQNEIGRRCGGMSQGMVSKIKLGQRALEITGHGQDEGEADSNGRR